MSDPDHSMADPATAERNRSHANSPSRRTILGAIAASGAVAAGSLPVAAQDDNATGLEQSGDGSGETGALEVVADFEPPALPENIAIAEDGTIYLSLAVTGEIRALEPGGDGNGESQSQSWSRETVTQFDLGEEELLLGLVVREGTIHAAVNSADPETHGVWVVDAESGDSERLAELPAADTEPNGIVHDPYEPEALLVSDHRGGAIWRVADNGAEPWVDDEVLDPDPEAEPGVGADGLTVHPNGDVYVDNLDYGRIVRVPVEDGRAGDPELILEDESLVGADGMTVDSDGRLYVAVNAQDEIVRLDLDGGGESESASETGDEPTIETITGGGGLDFPADVSFGRTDADATSLYACNFALETFQAGGDPDPGLVRLEVGAEGFFPEPGEFAGGAETDAGGEEGHGHEGRGHEAHDDSGHDDGA